MIKTNTLHIKYILKIIISISLVIISLFLINCPPLNNLPDINHDPPNLTGPWHLFIDDTFIQHTHNIQRTYHSFKKNKSNPLVKESKPVYLFGTVLNGSNGYSMWYQSFNLNPRESKIKYLQSTDGISWQSSHPDNNIVFNRSDEDCTPQVIYMPQETEQRRYALINYDYGRSAPYKPLNPIKCGYYIAFSHDGIHWNDQKDINPILNTIGDVGNFVYDPHDDKFIAYVKIIEIDKNGNRYRICGYSETRNITQWPTPRVILRPDEYDDYWITDPSTQRSEFYGLSAFAYETGYIGFLWIYQNTSNDGPIFIEIVSSQNGIDWNRQDPKNGKRIPILNLGSNGAWDSGMLFTPNHPLIVNNEIKLYYSGWNQTHGKDIKTAAIGLATLRKDGFASMDALTTPGIVTTKKIHSTGETLYINANAKIGEIRVAIYNSDGTPVPEYGLSECETITTDSTNIIISWNDKIHLPKGDIYFEFNLQNASIYSFALK